MCGGMQMHINTIPECTARFKPAQTYFAGISVYLFVFGATWGPVPWLLGAEIFPIRARAKGSALANISDWAFNFLIAIFTPPLFDVLRAEYYFLLMRSCIVSFFIVFFIYPETGNMSLEQLGVAFGDDMPERIKSRVQTRELPARRIRNIIQMPIMGETDRVGCTRTAQEGDRLLLSLSSDEESSGQSSRRCSRQASSDVSSLTLRMEGNSNELNKLE
jgi:hypothetical protein